MRRSGRLSGGTRRAYCRKDDEEEEAGGCRPTSGADKRPDGEARRRHNDGPARDRAGAPGAEAAGRAGRNTAASAHSDAGSKRRDMTHIIIFLNLFCYF